MRAILQENIIVTNAAKSRQKEMLAGKIVQAAGKPYSVISLIFVFFAVSFAGWVWEVALHFMTSGNLVNRGTLHGPWLPIYGAASVFLILFLRNHAARPVMLLTETIISCGLIEYITSFVLELIFKTRWWDYSDMPLNLNGRICAGGLVLFGLGGCVVIYILGPLLRKRSERFNKTAAVVICTAVLLIFAADVFISFTNIRTGAGITAALYTAGL